MSIKINTDLYVAEMPASRLRAARCALTGRGGQPYPFLPDREPVSAA